MANQLLDESSGATTTPIDLFLNEQADLSAVERFARSDLSDRTGMWSDLIPVSKPEAGQQYRFDVNLDTCTGCKACVTACHSLNGLDEGESFRSVGLLVGSDVLPRSEEVAVADAPEMPPVVDSVGVIANMSSPLVNQTVTTACHHCLDPACLVGCPAEAYEKDPVTGIVKHLDDACIGCEYCTMTCPYDVPVYNARLGIVRKCDMCSSRLAEGEAPACVQGCPNNAIRISTVSTTDITSRLEEPDRRLVPEAPASQLTAPTTRYRRAKTMASSVQPVDGNIVRPAHAHTPLAFMLVLSQLAIGLHLIRVLAGPWLTDWQTIVSALVTVVVTGIAATVSAGHLGQPLKAWRVVLGFRHSWLSREAIAVGVFFGMAAVGLAARVATLGAGRAIDGLTLVVGAITLVCSVMIYGFTGRVWWRPSLVAAKFGLTSLSLGLATMLIIVASTGEKNSGMLVAAVSVSLAAVVLNKLLLELAVFGADDVEQQGTARLLSDALAGPFRVRIAAGVLGAILLPVLLLGRESGWVSSGIATAVFGAVLVGELLARSLFFRASVSRQMPGIMK